MCGRGCAGLASGEEARTSASCTSRTHTGKPCSASSEICCQQSSQPDCHASARPGTASRLPRRSTTERVDAWSLPERLKSGICEEGGVHVWRQRSNRKK